MGDRVVTKPIRIAVMGLGKIARDQHLPSIAESPDFELVATVSRSSALDATPNYETIDALLAEDLGLDAVSLCMPPQARFQPAMAAIRAGKHVMLEKPPGATLLEVQILDRAARTAGISLFATWHSRHAPAVEIAKDHLAGDVIKNVRIDWKESVRKWHPGQEWIWQPGGLGVFDPGINALSILTTILPTDVFLERSKLAFPRNKDAPIAADLVFSDGGDLRVEAHFDWRVEGGEIWEISVETADRELQLKAGGSELLVDGEPVPAGGSGEYAGVYRRFADLTERGKSDVDLRPLAQVADAFLLGKRIEVEPFHD
ncbi:MAG: Gfo/Idh/MocA family protein [Geminicoccaceae bacterium]